ncbi:hypothetical protein [Mycoplasmopsis bovis]|uniref:hypothetical protein n=1 Tax=Mycoplasmopsis bovis TaxID=28903 RepID=UPI003D023B8C
MKKGLLLIGGLTAVAVVPISVTTTLLIKKISNKILIKIRLKNYKMNLNCYKVR